jgi:hypothetical protein
MKETIEKEKAGKSLGGIIATPAFTLGLVETTSNHPQR